MRKIAFAFLFLFLASTAFSIEYYPNETGQFIARVENSYSQPISASCFGSILYPDKTFFIANQSMTSTPFQNHYINFTVPFVYGIYETEARCTISLGFFNSTVYQSGSFKVEEKTVCDLTNITNAISEINNTVTEINTTVNEINSTSNYINYTISNFNTTIVANITANVTGNITQAVTTANDDLWIKIRNLMLSLWSII